MNLVIDSQFRPLTYDEMVKPLIQYKEAYDRVEQDYSTLAAQTEMWKDAVNQTNSPEAYEMYKNYSDELNTILDDFSKGMNINNRSALLKMKKDYYKSIVPIARASEAMNAANEFRVKAGPDAIFEVGRYNSIDDFLHGKTANNNYISKEGLTKKTAALTEAIISQVLEDPEFKEIMGDQFWMITQHTGGSYEDLIEALKLGIADNPIAQNRFSQIRQEVLKDIDINKYDAVSKQAIKEAVNTGLYAGLDKPVRNLQANPNHMTPLQSKHLKIAQDEHDWKENARNPLPLGNNAYFDPVHNLSYVQDSTGNKIYNIPNKSNTSKDNNRVNRLSNIYMVRKDKEGKAFVTQLDELPKDSQLYEYDTLPTDVRKEAEILKGKGSKDDYSWYMNNGHLVVVPKKVVMGTESDNTFKASSIIDGLYE